MRDAWTPWDKLVAWRASGLAGAALVLAFGVTAATDEGGLALGVRLGRALPLAPVCAAAGAWLAIAAARARGEERALEALGRSPWHVARASVVGGAAVAILAACAIAWVPRVDVAGFYPAATSASADAFRFVGGAFEGRGWRIAPSGEPAKSATTAGDASDLPAHARAAASLATALAGIALPLVLARARRKEKYAVALAVTALAVTAIATMLAFQAAAAGRVIAWGASAPSFVLLVLTAWRYRRESWQTVKSRR